MSLCVRGGHGGLATAVANGWFDIVSFLSVTALGPEGGAVVDWDGRGLGQEGW